MSSSTAIDTVAPGTAQASQLWLDVAVEQGDAAPPCCAPAVRSLRRAPRGARGGRRAGVHGTLLALAAAALAALALAAAGLVLAIRADLRDDRGELNCLEVQGG